MGVLADLELHCQHMSEYHFYVRLIAYYTLIMMLLIADLELHYQFMSQCLFFRETCLFVNIDRDATLSALRPKDHFFGGTYYTLTMMLLTADLKLHCPYMSTVLFYVRHVTY